MQKRTDNFLALDLEMNQPSDKIIQIGAVAGNIMTGEVLETLSQLVSIDEKLCTDPNICDIPKLTGITEKRLEEDGIPLPEAYRKLSNFRNKHNCHRNPIVWGGDDARCLKKELMERFDMEFSTGFGVNTHLPMFCFGHRWFDVKTFFQIHMFMNNWKMQSGLRKSVKRMGMTFEGKGHDAMWDAYNTFKLAHVMFSKMIIKNGDKDDE